jgi:hypothetical protein
MMTTMADVVVDSVGVVDVDDLVLLVMDYNTHWWICPKDCARYVRQLPFLLPFGMDFVDDSPMLFDCGWMLHVVLVVVVVVFEVGFVNDYLELVAD